MFFIKHGNDSVYVPELDSQLRKSDQKIPMQAVCVVQESNYTVWIIANDTDI